MVHLNMAVPALILLIPTVWGFWRGALRMVFSLGSLILAVVLTGMLQPKVSDWLRENTSIYETIKTEAAAQTEKVMEEFLQTPEKMGLSEDLTAPEETGLPAAAMPAWTDQMLTQEQQEQLLEILNMPEAWRSSLLGEAEVAAAAFADSVSTFAADMLWKLMTNLLTFALVMVIIRLISGR